MAGFDPFARISVDYRADFAPVDPDILQGVRIQAPHGKLGPSAAAHLHPAGKGGSNTL